MAGTIRPVTVAQIFKATPRDNGESWMIDQDQIDSITIVAQVISIRNYPTHSIYVITDGTGIIEAVSWFHDIGGDVLEQAYARVTGTLKSLEGKRYLNTKQIRLSLDPHEAYFHILDAMLVNRKLEIQSVSGRQSFTSSAGRHALAEGTSGNTSDD